MKTTVLALAKRGCILTGCLLLAAIFSGRAHAQSEEKNVFAPIPEPARARLIERLKLLTEYERAGRWAGIYDLRITDFSGGRDKYLAERKRWAAASQTPRQWLVDFTPQRIHNKYIYGSGVKAQWRIDGYATVREGGCRVRRLAVVHVAFRDNDWYFSGFGIEVAQENEPAKPCVDK